MLAGREGVEGQQPRRGVVVAFLGLLPLIPALVVWLCTKPETPAMRRVEETRRQGDREVKRQRSKEAKKQGGRGKKARLSRSRAGLIFWRYLGSAVGRLVCVR